jgi:hypothetical protein
MCVKINQIEPPPIKEPSDEIEAAMSGFGHLDEMIEREWLQKRVTQQEAWEIMLDGESEDQVDDEAQAYWRLFWDHAQPGDEVWYWSTPPASWERKAGRAGFVIVRNGKFVFNILTLMN